MGREGGKRKYGHIVGMFMSSVAALKDAQGLAWGETLSEDV